MTDEIESVNKEAKKLKAEGVKIIIALGHSGFTIDQKIAREVPDIDVVVGGHSNTFLFTGSDYPSIEKPVGPYPTIVKQPNGKKVPVVQAYAYSKYLGYLNLTFNNNGDLISYEGKPILLSQDKPQGIVYLPSHLKNQIILLRVYLLYTIYLMFTNLNVYLLFNRSNCLGTNKALQRENSKIPARNCGKYRCYLRGK